jgi:hypothetical protein
MGCSVLSLENALRSAGLNFSALVMDGQLHRCPTVAKPRKENGWYVIYEGGLAASYGNWEDDSSHFWRGENVDAETYKRIREKADALKAQREAEQIALADTALEFYESCAREGYSDYLRAKGVKAHGLRFDGSTLVMPLQDSTGKVWSYQKIYGNGDKYFLQGARVRGCYYIIGTPIDTVIVCEGFATGATIYEETGIPVIVALNAGNLKAVCDSLPFKNITVAADNDANGVGEKAAKDSGYSYVAPSSVGDFNDIPRESVRGYFVKEKKADENSIVVHGLVGEIADWITATAIRPQPLLSLAAALSFVGMIKGHRVRGKTDLRTNLMILAMAPTGGGKEHPQNAIKRLVKACGLQKHLMGEPVSGAGFLHALQKSGNVGYMVMDEVGRYIGNLSSAGAGVHQREILDYIIKTFSSANSILMGREKAAGAKEPRIDIENPHFCCYGSTVYEKFRDACGSGEIVDGFLNRWIVLESKERPDRQKKVKFSPPPQSIIDKVLAITSHSPYDSYGAPHPEEIEFTPEAWEIFDAYRDNVDELVKTTPYPLNQLISRAPEHIEKVAHTISEDGCTGIYDLRAAIKIVEFSNSCILRFAGMISDNIYEKDFVRVREIIKEAGEVQRNALTRRTQFITGGSKRRAEIVAALIDDGCIVERDLGRGMTAYKWVR